MKNKTEISNKDKFEGNPRYITKDQFDYLKEHLEDLGDLSGVVYCHNNKAFVGGNQRSEVFNGAKIEINERFETPTKCGTIAHGFILFQNEKYAYREVAFSENDFKKACIVANNDGGAFDWDVLSGWEQEELNDWGMVTPDEWNSEDYSEKNKEIDTDEFSDKMTLKFELSEDEFTHCMDKLSEIDQSKELALLRLLKYEA